MDHAQDAEALWNGQPPFKMLSLIPLDLFSLPFPSPQLYITLVNRGGGSKGRFLLVFEG